VSSISVCVYIIVLLKPNADNTVYCVIILLPTLVSTNTIRLVCCTTALILLNFVQTCRLFCTGIKCAVMSKDLIHITLQSICNIMPVNGSAFEIVRKLVFSELNGTLIPEHSGAEISENSVWLIVTFLDVCFHSCGNAGWIVMKSYRFVGRTFLLVQ